MDKEAICQAFIITVHDLWQAGTHLEACGLKMPFRVHKYNMLFTVFPKKMHCYQANSELISIKDFNDKDDSILWWNELSLVLHEDI